MRLEQFAEKHLAGYKDLPPMYQQDVINILAGQDLQYSAKQRGVSPDAIKQQRKKIFKLLRVADGRQMIHNLFLVAVNHVK